MWIEIFKAGTHTDSSGRECSYTTKDLDAMAEKYNAKVSDSESNEAPVVKGHPKTNEPAYGWVGRLGRRGYVLLAKLKGLSPEFVEEVGKGLFRNVSVALYPDGLLRHVGFLGAVAPAVKGLKSVQFSSEIPYKLYDDARLPSNPANSEGRDELQLLIEKNKELQTKLAYIEKDNRLREFRQYAEGLAEKCLITPAQCNSLIDILEMAHCNSLSEFEESKSIGIEKVKSFVESFRQNFVPGEIYKKGNSTKIKPEIDFNDSNVSAERLIIHNRALEIRSGDPGLSYSEASVMAQNEFL